MPRNTKHPNISSALAYSCTVYQTKTNLYIGTRLHVVRTYIFTPQLAHSHSNYSIFVFEIYIPIRTSIIPDRNTQRQFSSKLNIFIPFSTK